MNNDSSSAAEAGPGAPRPPPVDAAPAPSVSPAAQSSSNDDDGPEARLRKRTTIQTKKRSEFIHDIAVNLDMLIYAELCYMYYLECVLSHPPPSHPLPTDTEPQAAPSSASSSAQ